MPHSISPPPSSPPMEDTVLQDAHAVPSEGHQEASAGKHIEDAEMPDERTVDAAEAKNLEDMFDDDDEEDEFSSSAQTALQDSSQVESHSDPDTMRVFYQRLFPFRHLFQWLNHSPAPTTHFMHREFAFVLPNDAYIRY
ncbi:hypothetical protein LTR28_013605, partial [Elasticomyces elasticus]